MLNNISKSELCVGGVALRDGKILLVKRAHKPAKDYWSIPGGRVEEGETLEEAVKREMMEECGVNVEVGDIVCVAEVLRNGKHYVIVDFYVEFNGIVRVGDDALDAGWFELAEASVRVDVMGSTRTLCKYLLNDNPKSPYIKEFLDYRL